MKLVDLDFLRNEVKSEAFRNSIISHGLGDGSKAENIIKGLRSLGKDMRNATESRMTLYTSEINPYIYPNNSFITKSINDPQFATSGETKRLNDAVTGPAVTKGRVYAQSLLNGDNAPSSTVKIRKNTGHNWDIEYFHTNPTAMTFELTSEVPYEARGEMLQAHANVLNNAISNFTAVEWAIGEVGVAETVSTIDGASNSFIFSSGSQSRATSVVNGTATVKRICQEDFKRMRTSLIRQQLAKGNGLGGTPYYLPTAEQFEDMQTPALFPDFISYDKTGRQSLLDRGEIGMIYGFTILDPRVREDWGANVLYSYTALSGDETDLTKVEDTASAADNMVSAGLAWMDNQVLRAQGTPIVFPWMNSPIYFGDVYATEARYGAIRKRLDNKGVVMLIENPFTSQIA